jgi:branched-chain amino acid transport system substrate-binding protein
MKRPRSFATVLVAILGMTLGTMTLWGAGARAADTTIKIGYIDPFSGAFAAGGDASLKMFQFIIDNVNANGGALGKKFELVTFDDKLQPAEALIALKSVTDQNLPFVMSCVGSNVGSALIDGVNKHNTRNPDNRVLQINCGQLATELTNEQCSFWHFRFAGSVEMRAVARIKSLPASLKTVYLLNQDYLFGQSIRNDTKKYLALYRPDIKVVGDEMIPLMQVKDFSPYITKIKASGADSLVTGNYGPDLALLIKAGVDAGLNIRYDSFLGHVIGAPTAIGGAADGRLTSVMEIHDNIAVEEHNAEQEEFVKKWRATHDFGFIYINAVTQFDMMVRAINKAGSTDPLQVALALEGMEAKDMFGAVNVMRKEDHQLINPYYEAVLVKGQKYDVEKTGLGWKTEFKTTVEDETLPTTCKMKRPSS